MSPSQTPEPELLALARRLGQKNAPARADAAQELRERGPDGLDALLAVWQEEKRHEERRAGVAVGVMAFSLAIMLWFLHSQSQTAALTGAGVLIVGFIVALSYAMPTRLPKKSWPSNGRV